MKLKDYGIYLELNNKILLVTKEDLKIPTKEIKSFHLRKNGELIARGQRHTDPDLLYVSYGKRLFLADFIVNDNENKTLLKALNEGRGNK